MKNERYAVAYNDKIGNGFTETEPWIFDDFDDISQGRINPNRFNKCWAEYQAKNGKRLV